MGLEDVPLKKELEGYRDYSQKVPYSILPWIC
jgi:protein-S-isoprenylcysteine O-methyltransferase Ste14